MTVPSLTEAVAQALTDDVVLKAESACWRTPVNATSVEMAAAMRAVLTAALAPVIEQWEQRMEYAPWKASYKAEHARAEAAEQQVQALTAERDWWHELHGSHCATGCDCQPPKESTR